MKGLVDIDKELKDFLDENHKKLEEHFAFIEKLTPEILRKISERIVIAELR